MSISPRQQVALGALTTLQIGGMARHLLEANDRGAVVSALSWADERGLVVEVLGAGSNVVVADRGFEGLVLRVCAAGVQAEDDGDDVLVDVGAGTHWDELVRWSVERELAGLECLSGIPGDVGAAPIQNVGAYGQDVSHTIERVTLIERSSGGEHHMDRTACGFAYRDSVFKRAQAGRHVIVGVRFRLSKHGAPTIAYPELQRALAQAGASDLATVRATVIALRRNKSMVLDLDDENHRSAGSFFVNPIVSVQQAERASELALELWPDDELPRYPVIGSAGARVKLPAAWLIERAGMPKGTVEGRVGISTRHSLAIVNLGGATATELIAFAAKVRARVLAAFEVSLTPEPRFIGFDVADLAALREPAQS
jgi:UDP-N-acetylmuramate dehydrogenase